MRPRLSFRSATLRIPPVPTHAPIGALILGPPIVSPTLASFTPCQPSLPPPPIVAGCAAPAVRACPYRKETAMKTVVAAALANVSTWPA
jgi:hypothetical protein